MNPPDEPLADLDRLQRRALLVGAAGLALCAGGLVVSPVQFLQAYLQAYLFWIGIVLGCLALLMLQHLVGGQWGFPIRRLLEAATRTFPLLVALLVPLLLGLGGLYPWARPEEVAAEELLQHKSLYLNVPFFVIRAVVYFAIWILLAALLNRWSLEQDQTGDRSLARRLQAVSGPGLVLYGLTGTFSAIDWAMSLEPRWYSTIYGLAVIAGQGLAGLAFVIVVAHLLGRRKPLSDVASPAHFHDLGNLLLTFLMLWAYMAFSQFLVIWAENLAEEIPWYLQRTTGGWQGIAVALIVLQFAVPFVLLLSRATKRTSSALAAVATVILLMHYVDLFWLVAPAFHPMGLRVHWMDVAAPVGMGGLWVSAFLWRLKQMPLLPLHDPRMEEALEPVGGA